MILRKKAEKVYSDFVLHHISTLDFILDKMLHNIGGFWRNAYFVFFLRENN